jgi:hypothetical protein
MHAALLGNPQHIVEGADRDALELGVGLARGPEKLL